MEYQYILTQTPTHSLLKAKIVRLKLAANSEKPAAYLGLYETLLVYNVCRVYIKLILTGDFFLF